jgi:asparagine synthase (glutamine-hydrolysing)
MRAYFAALWNPDDPVASKTVEGVIACYRSIRPQSRPLPVSKGFFFSDLGTQTTHTRQLVISAGAQSTDGLVYGTLFRKSDQGAHDHQVNFFSSAENDRLIQSTGRTLLEDYWGNFVGFFRHESGFSILTDPTASLPCYYTFRNGACFVFSNLELCPWLDMSGFTVNRRFIADLFAYDKILTGETGLNEVHELLGGEMLRLDDAHTYKDLIWDPRDIASDTLRCPVDLAAAQLRSTVCRTVQSWGHTNRNIAVSLSGGLDSSIVLAALAYGSRKAPVHAIHFCLGSEDPPELSYARQTARLCGCPVEDILIEPGEGLDRLPEHHPPTVRPFRQFTSPDLAALLPEHLQLQGGVRFTGQGGDHLFRDVPDAAMFADYLLRHGPGPDTGRRLLDAARLSGHSIWKVMADTGHLIRQRGALSPYLETIRKRQNRLNQFANAPEDIAGRLPVWTREAKGLPPAKFSQVCALLHMTQLRQNLASTGHRETLHPLISQPLIELCLRLPAWTLSTNGANRGLARVAFKGLIPEPVRLRTAKGSASRFYVARVSRFRDQIVDTLKHGELVSLGLLTDNDVEAYGARDSFMIESSGVMMLFYYGIECWLRTWARQQNNSPSHTPTM